MKVRLKKLEAYNALNSTELKVILRDINLEISQLKQQATDLKLDSGMNAIHKAATSLTIKGWRIKAVEIDHRSSTLNNHAEYILIIIASKRK